MKKKKKKIKKVIKKEVKKKPKKPKRMKMTKDEKKVVDFILFLSKSDVLDSKIVASPFEKAILKDTLRAITFRLAAIRLAKFGSIGYDDNKNYFNIYEEEK